MPTTNYYKKTVINNYYLVIKSTAGVIQYIQENEGYYTSGTFAALPSGTSSATATDWTDACSNVDDYNRVGSHPPHKPTG